MTTRAEVAEAARRFVGTGFRHRGRIRGAGCDCAGVPLLVADELGLAGLEDLPRELQEYAASYARLPDPAKLKAILSHVMDEVRPFGDWKTGDVLLMHNGVHGNHLGVIAERHGRPTIVYAQPRQTVVEVHLSPAFVADRVVSGWRFRGLED